MPQAGLVGHATKVRQHLATPWRWALGWCGVRAVGVLSLLCSIPVLLIAFPQTRQLPRP